MIMTTRILTTLDTQQVTFDPTRLLVTPSAPADSPSPLAMADDTFNPPPLSHHFPLPPSTSERHPFPPLPTYPPRAAIRRGRSRYRSQKRVHWDVPEAAASVGELVDDEEELPRLPDLDEELNIISSRSSSLSSTATVRPSRAVTRYSMDSFHTDEIVQVRVHSSSPTTTISVAPAPTPAMSPASARAIEYIHRTATPPPSISTLRRIANVVYNTSAVVTSAFNCGAPTFGSGEVEDDGEAPPNFIYF